MNAIDQALQPARVMILSKDRRYADDARLWQGIPSIEKTAGGAIYVIFYSGMKTEGSGNFAVVIRSRDQGRTWNSPYMIIEHPDPGVRVYDPCAWIDPCGRLWLFWTQSNGFFDGRCGVWAITSSNPDADQPIWTAAVRLANGVMMNKPIALRNGTWLLPCAIWACRQASENYPELAGERRSNAYASTDSGRTFVLRGGADVPERSFDEHMMVERQDDRLWMLVRTAYGIGQSFSADGGYTWTPGERSALSGPCSRFFIRRLRSGRLLLVNHVRFTGRNNLTAQLSEDEGQTWSVGLLLDERDAVSYPDGVEDQEGLITVVYDRERYAAREINLAVFTEQDILAGRCAGPQSRLKILINQATG